MWSNAIDHFKKTNGANGIDFAWNFKSLANKVPPAGLEPATSALEERCSIQLSYRGSDFSDSVVSINLPALTTKPVGWRGVF